MRRVKPGDVCGAGSMSRRGRVQYVDGGLLEPGEGGWHRLYRRQCLHADGHLPIRYMHGVKPGGVYRVGSMSRRGDVQPGYGNVLEPDEGEWHVVQRQRCLYAVGYVSCGHVHWVKPGDVYSVGSMSRRGDVQPGHGNVLEPDESGWCGVQRRRCLHHQRCVYGWRMHERRASHVYGAGSMSRSGHVQSRDGHVQQSRGGRWHNL